MIIQCSRLISTMVSESRRLKRIGVVVGRDELRDENFLCLNLICITKQANKKTITVSKRKALTLSKLPKLQACFFKKNNSFGTVVLYVKLYKLIRSAVNYIMYYTLGQVQVYYHFIVVKAIIFYTTLKMRMCRY